MKTKEYKSRTGPPYGYLAFQGRNISLRHYSDLNMGSITLFDGHSQLLNLEYDTSNCHFLEEIERRIGQSDFFTGIERENFQSDYLFVVEILRKIAKCPKRMKKFP